MPRGALSDLGGTLPPLERDRFRLGCRFWSRFRRRRIPSPAFAWSRASAGADVTTTHLVEFFGGQESIAVGIEWLEPLDHAFGDLILADLAITVAIEAFDDATAKSAVSHRRTIATGARVDAVTGAIAAATTGALAFFAGRRSIATGARVDTVTTAIAAATTGALALFAGRRSIATGARVDTVTTAIAAATTGALALFAGRRSIATGARVDTVTTAIAAATTGALAFFAGRRSIATGARVDTITASATGALTTLTATATATDTFQFFRSDEAITVGVCRAEAPDEALGDLILAQLAIAVAVEALDQAADTSTATASFPFTGSRRSIATGTRVDTITASATGALTTLTTTATAADTFQFFRSDEAIAVGVCRAKALDEALGDLILAQLAIAVAVEALDQVGASTATASFPLTRRRRDRIIARLDDGGFGVGVITTGRGGFLARCQSQREQGEGEDHDELAQGRFPSISMFSTE